MRTQLLLVVSAFSIALSGCSAQPIVKYELIHGSENYEGDFEGLAKFNLAKSVLFVSYADEGEGGGIKMVSIPAETDSARYMIRPTRSMGVETRLNVVKIDNTDIISSVGTEVEDNRQKIIQATGAVAVGLIGVMEKPAPGAILPLTVETEPFLNTTKSKEADAEPRQGSIQNANGEVLDFIIEFGALPVDAIARDVFERKINDERQNVIFYSACRTAKITFLGEPVNHKQFTVTVADPNFVQTARFPEKGKIEMHSACGSNTTTAESSVSSTVDVIGAVIAQAKTVREAWKTKSKSDVVIK